MKSLGYPLAVAVGLSLSACALLPHHRRPSALQVRPLPAPAALPNARADDGLYASAANAIGQRSYAVALDLLQDARDRSPGDVRVLNALGVVYDKLGRFDISARYYSQAQAIDPGSAVIRQNLAYSAMLQSASHGEAPARLAIVTPQFSPSAGATLATIGPNTVRIAAASSPSQPSALTGHPLALTDATGRKGVADPVRMQLVRLGWTAPAAALSPGKTQAFSQIVYAPTAKTAADALARTLRTKLRMDVCSDGCQGVRLVLGADTLNWGARRPAPRPRA